MQEFPEIIVERIEYEDLLLLLRQDRKSVV